ncbi:hypothetical protein BH11PSE11_BH11PSE11_27080 [soil metagenome]
MQITPVSASQTTETVDRNQLFGKRGNTMGRSPTPFFWLAGMGFSFAAGFGLAWQMQTPDLQVDTSRVSQSAGTQVRHAGTFAQLPNLWTTSGTGQSSPETSLTVDELWAKSTARDKAQFGDEALDSLRQMIQKDPVALQKILHRYGRENDAQNKETLKALLASVQKPEVLAYSVQLAGSDNPAQRQDGFELLKMVSSSSSELRSLVKQAMASEQAPEVLSQAIAALTPTVVAAPEGAAIVAQLGTLAQHKDAGVRSQSIIQLAQWDKSGNVEAKLSQALTDQSPEVRQAAVTAINESGVRSDSMKLALLGVIRSGTEKTVVRDGALHALERFSLTPDEYASYSQARMEVDKRSLQ